MGVTSANAPRRLGRLALGLVEELLILRRCAACNEILTGRAIFCAPCAATVVLGGCERRPGIGPLAAFGEHGGALADAIARFKYQRRSDLAEPLATLLVRAIRRFDLSPTLLVPVPLHPLRLAERGYNQAALLSQRAGKTLGVEVAPRALRRLRPTAAQAALDRQARADNVRGAFVSRGHRGLRGARVLLVDDVATTGETLRACAEPIRTAGAASVAAAVLARRPAGSEPPSPSLAPEAGWVCGTLLDFG